MRPLHYWFWRELYWREGLGPRRVDDAGAQTVASQAAHPTPKENRELGGLATPEDERRPSPRVQEAAARLRRGESDVQRIATLTQVPPALVALIRDDLLARDGTRSPSPETAPYRSSRRGRSQLLIMALALSIAAIGCSVCALVTGRAALGYVGMCAEVLALTGHRLASRTRR